MCDASCGRHAGSSMRMFDRLSTRLTAILIAAQFSAAILLPNAALAEGPASVASKTQENRAGLGVCPPFNLYDEDGNLIDPVHGINADRPYSPKQTCGKCHDYNKITEGYHFQQGADEPPPAELGERCQWVSTPGNYGGAWCSPAPLYQYLSPKHNTTDRTMDMTSFTFITAGCGECHPGGGPMEHDRDGKRYDKWMSNPASGFKPGADNNLDGDYYKARWSETGVLEADCMICHMPEYDFSRRKDQLGKLNFRWAATDGARFGTVRGSVREGENPIVTYDVAQFDPSGTVSPHIVREPRNDACLACHAKPGWKKRGANFRARTDVHLAAGLKCVDCHPSGSHADDVRIKGKEVHQLGKGDDPGGFVRDDLDNTHRDCTYCHLTGYLNAPVARHDWLPPLHLEKIACQTCHIPERAVRAAQVQASDVFNPGARIPTPGKHLWTFYGPDATYWNHYGELEMMGYDDKPTDPYRPVLARYKGKIYPVNRVHTAWPGIEVEGKPGLMQPKMGDIYTMWSQHLKDPARWSELSTITDDNGDAIIEVNRTEEIDALINAVTAYLRYTGYPLDGKRVVWVYDDRVYTSGADYRTLRKHDYEASPYGNVHKYSHDVFPARAALGGRNGCTDCHSRRSPVLFAPTLQLPFDRDAQPVIQPQFNVLGLNRASALLGAFREQWVKTTLYFGLGLCLLMAWSALVARAIRRLEITSIRPIVATLPTLAVVAAVLGSLYFACQPELRDYMLPSRRLLDRLHFLLGLGLVIAGLATSYWWWRNVRTRTRFWVPLGIWVGGSTGLAIGAGALMVVRLDALEAVTRFSYTVFDCALVTIVYGITAILAWQSVHGGTQPDRPSPSKS